MVYLCLPMANQGAYVIKKSTPFEVIPVSSDIFCQLIVHLDRRAQSELSSKAGSPTENGELIRPVEIHRTRRPAWSGQQIES
jgi:hypothetical protein